MVGAVIYVRVSTKEQTENLSLPTQLRACEEYCRRQGYEILERFHEEGESAKTTDRSQLQNLLTFCRLNKGRVHFVVVFNLTRFARDKYDHFALRSHLQSLGISLRSSKVPLRKGATGAGLQIAFEIDSLLLVLELDDHMQLPGPVARGVGAAARVVVGETPVDIVCETDVTARLGSVTLRRTIDDALRCHARIDATASTERGNRESLAAIRRWAERPMQLLRGQRRREVRGFRAFCVTQPSMNAARQRRGLPSRSSFRGGHPSAVAPSTLWRTTSAWHHERRLVDQTGIEPVTS